MSQSERSTQSHSSSSVCSVCLVRQSKQLSVAQSVNLTSSCSLYVFFFKWPFKVSQFCTNRPVLTGIVLPTNAVCLPSGTLKSRWDSSFSFHCYFTGFQILTTKGKHFGPIYLSVLLFCYLPALLPTREHIYFQFDGVCKDLWKLEILRLQNFGPLKKREEAWMPEE